MRTVVMTPTYNEADNIEQLASLLLALEPALEVVVVDDGSPDGTGDIADKIAATEPRFHVVHRTGKRGYAAASREGLAWCLAQGFECIASMDADLSHDPASLTAMRAAIDAGADVAIGSRYCEGGQSLVDWGPVRRAVSQMGSAYARIMVGTPVRDCTSGYRCYRAEMLTRVPFDRIGSEGYSFLIELLAGLTDAGARIVEVPITYTDRRAGQSKISRAIVLEALWRTTLLGLTGITGIRRAAARRAGAHG